MKYSKRNDKIRILIIMGINTLKLILLKYYLNTLKL